MQIVCPVLPRADKKELNVSLAAEESRVRTPGYTGKRAPPSRDAREKPPGHQAAPSNNAG